MALSAILLALTLSSCAKSNDEINQTETETITQTETEQITTTQNTTAPQLTQLTETSQTEVEVKSEVVLPKGTYEYDIREMYGEFRPQWIPNMDFMYVDSNTMCFYYLTYENSNCLEEEMQWNFKFYDRNSKILMYHLSLPADDIYNQYIFMRNSSLADNTLCEFDICNYDYDDSRYVPNKTLVITKDFDSAIIQNDENAMYLQSCGNHYYYYNEYSIYDANSDEIIVAGKYTEPYDKTNRHQSVTFEIDENRFVYTTGGWECTWGFGVYDFTTNTARDVDDTHNVTPFCYYNGKIYSEMYDMGWQEGIIYTTDADTLETTAFIDKSTLSDGYQYSSNYFFADGKYLLFGADNGMNGMKFLVVNSDTGDVVDEFSFQNTGWLSVPLTNGYKIILKSLYDDYLYVMDLSYLDEIQ